MEKTLSTPRVTVVMPAYNAMPYLREAIESVLGQTFGDFEFLIFDDGSTDGSADTIAEYAKKDPRIKAFFSRENKGYVDHLNEGVRIARGEYVARMDADDVSLPERFEKQVRYLDAHEGVGVVGTSVNQIDRDGKVSTGWTLRATPAETKVHFLFTNYLLHPTVMMRKSAIPTEAYRKEYMPAEDFDLWTRILEGHDLYSLPEPLLNYRTHANNTSSKKWDTLLSNASEIVRRQLRGLGIDTTDEEALAYHKITMFETAGIPLETIRSWFEKIWFANLVKKTYPAHILFSTLAGRWLIIIKRSSGLSAREKASEVSSFALALARTLSARELAVFLGLSVKRSLRFIKSRI